MVPNKQQVAQDAPPPSMSRADQVADHEDATGASTNRDLMQADNDLSVHVDGYSEAYGGMQRP